MCGWYHGSTWQHLLPRARVAPLPVASCRLHGVQVEPVDHHTSIFPRRHGCNELTSTYNLLSSFLGLAAKGTTTKKAAAAEVTLVVVGAATPKTWPRSTPKITDTGDTSRGRLSSDDQNRSLSLFFFGPTDALLAACPFLVSVFPSRRRCFV